MKILGIDYGRRKIGVALADTITKLVEPLNVPSISKYVQENDVRKIIIGLAGGSLDDEIKKFGERVANDTGLPVEYFDETLTTQDAQKLLLASGAKRKKRKNREDAVAAALMLQYYLEGGGKNV